MSHVSGIRVVLVDLGDEPTLLLLAGAAAFRWLASELEARRVIELGGFP